MVDGSGLENRHTRKGIGGSNPSFSAITNLDANEIGLDARYRADMRQFGTRRSFRWGRQHGQTVAPKIDLLVVALVESRSLAP